MKSTPSMRNLTRTARRNGRALRTTRRPACSRGRSSSRSFCASSSKRSRERRFWRAIGRWSSRGVGGKRWLVLFVKLLLYKLLFSNIFHEELCYICFDSFVKQVLDYSINTNIQTNSHFLPVCLPCLFACICYRNINLSNTKKCLIVCWFVIVYYLLQSFFMSIYVFVSEI